MSSYQFSASEYCFPIWGRLAMEMAKDAGFTGIQITDGGGYLQPHPKNNGFVEYERFGLDLRRKDSFPLTDPTVQKYYLETAEKTGIQLTGIYLYLLDHQGFIKFADRTPQGQQCRETIRNAVKAASEMGIPLVTIPANGMFGVGQHTYAFEKLRYAVEVGVEFGVQVAASMDTLLSRQLEILEKLDGKLKLNFNTIDPTFYATGDAPALIRSLKPEQAACFRVRDMAKTDEGFVVKEESRNTLLGQGDAGFAACAAAIRENGYTGWIVSETPYYSQDLAELGSFSQLAKRDLETLEQVFNG